jgi:hypothetical protein
MPGQVKLLITNYSFCIGHRATAQSKLWGKNWFYLVYILRGTYRSEQLPYSNLIHLHSFSVLLCEILFRHLAASYLRSINIIFTRESLSSAVSEENHIEYSRDFQRIEPIPANAPCSLQEKHVLPFILMDSVAASFKYGANSRVLQWPLIVNEKPLLKSKRLALGLEQGWWERTASHLNLSPLRFMSEQISNEVGGFIKS